MRIFVSEFVTCGAWPDELPRGSLLREGRSMLAAILADCARIPHCEAVTTWDRRLGPPKIDGVQVFLVGDAQDVRRAYEDRGAVEIGNRTGK